MSERDKHIAALLKKHQLRNTKMRQDVVSLFISHPEVALSHQDIESELSDADRVTLYRTLKSFEQKGIVHQVIDGSGVLKYALCHLGCDEHQHVDNHAHFHCNKCGKTTCMEGVKNDDYNIPSGYEVETSHIVIQGSCKDCT